MSESFSFTVLGRPCPKGSLKIRPTAKGPRLEWRNNEAIESWSQRIRFDALQARPDGWPLNRGVCLAMDFYFLRPKSHSKKGRIREHLVRPDREKLVRTVEDALAGVVYLDDSQAAVGNSGKFYADDGAPERTEIAVYIRETPVCTTPPHASSEERFERFNGVRP